MDIHDYYCIPRVFLPIYIFKQATWTRYYITIILVSFLLIHEMLIDPVKYQGWIYHLSDAILYLCIMASISKIKPYDILTIEISVLCVVAIITNAIGLILYETYQPPIYYDNTFCIINIIAICLLRKRGKTNQWTNYANGGGKYYPLLSF